MTLKCPKGHWYEPDAGGVGGCPQCATQTQNETSVSDDDVLAIMSQSDARTKPAIRRKGRAKFPRARASCDGRRFAPSVHTRRCSRSLCSRRPAAEAGSGSSSTKCSLWPAVFFFAFVAARRLGQFDRHFVRLAIPACWATHLPSRRRRCLGHETEIGHYLDVDRGLLGQRELQHAAARPNRRLVAPDHRQLADDAIGAGGLGPRGGFCRGPSGGLSRLVAGLAARIGPRRQRRRRRPPWPRRTGNPQRFVLGKRDQGQRADFVLNRTVIVHVGDEFHGGRPAAPADGRCAAHLNLGEGPHHNAPRLIVVAENRDAAFRHRLNRAVDLHRLHGGLLSTPACRFGPAATSAIRPIDRRQATNDTLGTSRCERGSSQFPSSVLAGWGGRSPMGNADGDAGRRPEGRHSFQNTPRPLFLNREIEWIFWKKGGNL